MIDEHLNNDVDAAVAASRPASDIAIAREAGEVIGHMLGDRLSVVDPTATIWTAEVAEELRARVEDNLIRGSEQNQWEKFDQQLRGASREVILMAAELAFLRGHPVHASRPETRRAHVERVLANIDPTPAIPESMSRWLAEPHPGGGFESGQGYHGRLWQHIVWLATFVRTWDRLPENEREAARADPWVLQQVMLDSSGDVSPDIRNALQFLARPEVFEPIASANYKAKIRQGLAHRIGGSTGNDPESLDRDILAIRASLAGDIDGPFHFWFPEVRPLWDAAASSGPADSAGPEEPRPRHYWLYSPGARASEWDEFSQAGIMGIGWHELGDLADYPNREAIRQALDTDGSGRSMTNATLALWQFQHEIAVGDVVYAKRGKREIVGRGEVTSDARYEPERGEFPQVRSVAWTHIGSWPHPGEAAMKTLTDITRYGEYVDQLKALVVESDDEDVEVTDPLVAPATPYDRESFLDEVYLSEERYDRLRALVLRKKNLILAGPPGVGKTYAAKRLAYSIMGAKDPSRVQMVQFHQSYSYEDFMMGYRPTETGGFTLVEGPFYRFCEEARADDANRPYFFLVDEINRGNISKIFGELLMLIEADKRGQDLRLLYKNETFSVPPNVHIIGMMNTADRSLAVLDYALRRRFGFFEMAPGFDSEGFQRWQHEAASPALDQLVSVVVDLNTSIAQDAALGQGFAVGHSFLSRPTGADADDAWLYSVVEDELIPLLDEYWFDEPEKAAEWAGKLRAAVA